MDIDEQYQEVKKFFKDRYSDLDTAAEENSRDPYTTLISCIISQRTKEERTKQASKRLFSKADSPEQMDKLSQQEIKESIKPAGMYNQKSKRIKQTTKQILEEYNGKVPKSRVELMKLPGVGYKTADVTRCFGFGIETIPVDTHVNRIPKRLGWVPEDSSKEQVKEKLEEITPKNERGFFHVALIHFGRDICLPRKPKCEECQFTGFCDYYKENIKK